MSTNAGSPARRPELSVVMPVYNEAGVVGDVVRAWAEELYRLGAEFELRAYDDGSTDSTAEVLREAARNDPRIVPIRQQNRGHGPTVLRGYREATSEWIFQVDSDDELGPDAFGDLWRRREGYDLLLGRRRNRSQSVGRRLITAVSRGWVRLLFGRGVRDVNAPYRLFRRSALERLLPCVPEAAFAPNVILSGLAVRAGLRIYEGSVTYRERRAGRGSLTSARLWKGAVRSFWETFRAALAARRALR